MMGRTTIWRRFGGLLAACLLTVLVIGPTFDAAICSGDLAGVADVASAELHQAGETTDDPHKGEAVACAHGHCHHGSPWVPFAVLATAEAPTRSERLALAPPRIPPSATLFGLMRPPRA